MIISRVVCSLFVLALCAPVSVMPQRATGNPENWCRNGLFPGEGPPFKLARIVGPKGARVYFYTDEGNCPNVKEPKCKAKSYLVSGDRVIVSRQYGDWACSWFQPARGRETVGWLPLENLSISEPDANPPLDRWLGTWKYYDNSLEIKRGSRSGALSVRGDALWRGLGDNVHVGEIEATARPQGRQLKLSDESCQLSLVLVGDFIVAADNAECGGMNVRFDGVYRNVASAKRR